jgi:hypothetical protein
LIPALNPESAARLASAMLQDVWTLVQSHAGVRPILATTGPGSFPVSVPDTDIWLQGDGDLGVRIERIIHRGLRESPSVIALGADSPAFTPAHLDAALAHLESHDAVLGPSTDGGFYLLGLRRSPPGLFASLPWSSSTTRQALTARLRDHAFSIAELDPLFDVDTPADLLTLAAHLAAQPHGSSATRAWWLQNSCQSASSSQL